MNKPLYIYLILWMSFTFSIESFSQAKIDSLIKVTDTCSDERKPIVYGLLADEFFYVDDYEQSLKYYLKSAEEALKNKDTSYATVINGYGNAGFLCIEMAKYDKAIDYNGKALKYALLDSNYVETANAYSSLGNSYMKLADFENAANYFVMALATDLKAGNHSMLSLDYNALGKLYQQWGKYEIALEYFRKALRIDEKGNALNKMAIRFNSIGLVYQNIGMYDSAIFYLNKALRIDKEFGKQKKIAIRMSNLANVYTQINEFGQAEKLFKEAIGIFTLLKNSYSLCITYNELSDMYFHKKEYRLSELYANKSLGIAKDIQLNNIVKENYKRLSRISKINNDYKKAYKYYLLFTDMKDSIFNEKSMNAISLLEVKHQTKKKEIEIELLSKRNKINKLELEKNEAKRQFLIIYLIIAVIMVLVVLTVILIVKKSNIKLANKNMELSLLNATKDKFFSIIAHDLKNPMSAFKNIADSLNENAADLSTKEIKYFTGQLKQSSGRLNLMLENLLQWAKSQLDGVKLQVQTLELNELVAGIIRNNQYIAINKNIRLINEIEHDTKIETDKNILVVILRNLITNGINFTNKGGSVTISGETNGKYFTIKVKDTGIGILEEDQKKLFRIAINTKTIGAPEEKGSGLGLILCSELVKKIKGNISVESSINEGSTFMINLPNYSS